jgi:hypothetical protein
MLAAIPQVGPRSAAAIVDGSATHIYLPLVNHLTAQWNRVGMLATSDPVPSGYFGARLAISGDSQTVVAGSIDPNSGVGSLYIFQTASSWSGETNEVARIDSPFVKDGFGSSLAVSEDGSTIVASAGDRNSQSKEAGSVYVFTRPSSGWTNAFSPTAKLTVSDPTSGDFLGVGVAISGDGATIAVTAANPLSDRNSRTAVYVFTRPGNEWHDTHAIARLAVDNNDVSALAIASDGRTIAVGIAGNSGVPAGIARGAVFLFVQPVSGWASTSVATAVLLADDSQDYAQLGATVALSATGRTVVAGAPGSANGGPFGYDPGALYVFTQPDSGWTTTDTPTAKLIASDGKDDDRLGQNLAISAGGDSIIAGTGQLTGPDELYVFAPGADGWHDTTEHTLLKVGKDNAFGELTAGAVAMSANGSTAIIGAPYYSRVNGMPVGAAYILVR